MQQVNGAFWSKSDCECSVCAAHRAIPDSGYREIRSSEAKQHRGRGDRQPNGQGSDHPLSPLPSGVVGRKLVAWAAKVMLQILSHCEGIDPFKFRKITFIYLTGYIHLNKQLSYVHDFGGPKYQANLTVCPFIYSFLLSAWKHPHGSIFKSSRATLLNSSELLLSRLLFQSLVRQPTLSLSYIFFCFIHALVVHYLWYFVLYCLSSIQIIDIAVFSLE